MNTVGMSWWQTVRTWSTFHRLAHGFVLHIEGYTWVIRIERVKR